MDIYSYLNSKDVAEHCRKLNYQFNTIEAAFIINFCRRLTVKERHNVFIELMSEMPDMQLPKKLSYKCEDLGLFHNLKEKIKAESNLLERLYNGNGNLIYRYSIYYMDSKCDVDSTEVYSSYEKAKIAALENLEEREQLIFKASEPDSTTIISCYCNRDNEIMDISVNDGAYSKITDFFDDIWIYIPTPFKKGDLLYLPENDAPYSSYFSNTPMVLTHIAYWDKDEAAIERKKETWDSSDMTAYGFWPDAPDHVYDECCHNYYDLEYYRGELIGTRRYKDFDFRLLKAISAYMQGKINEDMFLAANNLIRAEKLMKKSFPTWDYVEESYKEAGIADIWDKRKLIREYEEKKNERK